MSCRDHRRMLAMVKNNLVHPLGMGGGTDPVAVLTDYLSAATFTGPHTILPKESQQGHEQS